MGVSKNRGTPKSSILIGFSIINHPFWGTIIFGNTNIQYERGWNTLWFKKKGDFRPFVSGAHSGIRGNWIGSAESPQGENHGTKIKYLIPHDTDTTNPFFKSVFEVYDLHVFFLFIGGSLHVRFKDTMHSSPFPGARHTTARSSFTVTRSVTSVLVFVHGYNCPTVLLLHLAWFLCTMKTILLADIIYYVHYISTHTTLIPWSQHDFFKTFSMLPVAVDDHAEDWACMRLGQLMTLGHLVLGKGWRGDLWGHFSSRGHWITLLWEIQECKNLHSLKRSQQVETPENGWLEDESPFGMVYFQWQTCCQFQGVYGIF